DAMVDAIDEFMPMAGFTSPLGGLFLWATLPEVVDTTDLLARALEKNVAFVPGAGAFLDGTGTSSMRLTFSATPPERIREGIRRIGAATGEVLDLARSL